jgi:hypothetical protein
MFILFLSIITLLSLAATIVVGTETAAGETVFGPDIELEFSWGYVRESLILPRLTTSTRERQSK